MKRPLIGVTPGWDDDKKLAFVKYGYCEGIMEAGGIPTLLSHTADENRLSVYLERLDGFLITGGPDLDPRHYGEMNLPFNGSISPIRDSLEIYLAREAVRLGKPVFGICRGAQVLNVAFGGTLYQDIEKQLKGELIADDRWQGIQPQDNRVTGGQAVGRLVLRHSQDAPRWYPTHDIAIEPGSIVHRASGSSTLAVNSFHHQAVKAVAPGWVITSTAPDGIVESVEHPGQAFCVGVQWHPEHMWQNDMRHLALFSLFVESCGK